MTSPSLPWLSPAFRPTLDEIETYARLIMRHEGRAPNALEQCRREAEFHLWIRNCAGWRVRKVPPQKAAAAAPAKMARLAPRTLAAAAR